MLRKFIKIKTILFFITCLSIFSLIYAIWNSHKNSTRFDDQYLLDLEVTDVVFFDITMGRLKLGRIEIGLFGNIAPKTVKNFVALAQGFPIIQEGKEGWISYNGTTFHRVIKDFMIQGGNVSQDNSTENISLFGGLFPDENFLLGHQSEGWVSMANKGPNTNACQFFITLAAAPWLDGHHVVFGKVVTGMEVVRTIGAVETVRDQPRTQVRIEYSGSKIPTEAQKNAFSKFQIN